MTSGGPCDWAVCLAFGERFYEKRKKKELNF